MTSVTLVGDGIENPANAAVMAQAATMFGAACRVRPAAEWSEWADRADRAEWADAAALPAPIDAGALAALHARRIAFDNLPRAADVYGFRAGHDFAVMVGNERRGLTHSFRALATDAVQIPMHSRRINCLNVAAASAVALFYLCAPPVRPIMTRTNVDARRPELLLAGAGDHVELGSAIRSATAFGWERAFVEDRERVWFGVDRVVRSEGRAAARRARNHIRLVPCAANTRHGAREVVIVTTGALGVPIQRCDLARGPRQIVVLPDESRIDVATEDWQRLAGRVTFARIEMRASGYRYHYRLLASIALAEVARQVGRRAAGVRRPREAGYELALPAASLAAGEVVSLDELMAY